jgi:hypothetical protein
VIGVIGGSEGVMGCSGGRIFWLAFNGGRGEKFIPPRLGVVFIIFI